MIQLGLWCVGAVCSLFLFSIALQIVFMPIQALADYCVKKDIEKHNQERAR